MMSQFIVNDTKIPTYFIIGTIMKYKTYKIIFIYTYLLGNFIYFYRLYN